MKNRFLAIITAVFLSVGAFSTPFQEYIGACVTAEAAANVYAPTCSKSSGKYYSDGSLGVKLYNRTKGATIYYSVNGGSYKRYTKTIYITENSTLKYYAKKSGVTSKISTRTYKLLPKFTITPSAGSYEDKQTIKLTSKIPGLKFYYTLDGSKPTTNSKLYTAKGITIDESCTLRIRTSKIGWNSRIVTKQFVISSIADEEPVITTQEGSILEEYKNKYGYSQLTEKQKQLYEKLFNGVAAHAKEIDITSLECNATDVEKAFYAMNYDNPQFFWLSTGYKYTYIANTVYSVKPVYSRTAQQAAELQPKIEAAAQTIIDNAMKKDNLFEQVLYIHDVIVNRCTYTDNGEEYIRGVDGVLLNGRALCEGYSKTFAYLCQLMGIESFCVIGDSDGPHMWNMVKLSGDWYYMDTTFDDPIGEIPTCVYTYFCITEAELKQTHTLKNIVPVPEATEDDYNYYNAMNIPVYDDVTEAYSAILKLVAKNYDDGIYYSEIICTNACIKKLYNYAVKKGSDVFKDLKELGCSPKGVAYGYTSDKFYIKTS